MIRFPKLAALTLGGLSALGFAPLGWWPATLVALALWMAHVAAAQTRRAALARGYWFGVGHFCVGLNWIAGSFQYQDTMPKWLGWFAVVALALYIAVYPALAAGLAWRWGVDSQASPLPFRGGDGGGGLANPSQSVSPHPNPSPEGEGLTLPFILFLAAGWIVTEWLRATMFTGFAWNPLGVVAVEKAGLLPFIGTYGLSGLVVAGAGSGWLLGQRNWKAAIGLAAPILLAMALVQPWFSKEAMVNRPAIRIVQPNIGQQDKHSAAFGRISHARLAQLTGKPGDEPRLIFWPEAAIPDYLEEDDEEAVLARAKITALLGPKDIVLTGGVKRHFKRINHKLYYEEELVGARNGLFGVDATGKLLFRYDKSHLVPYGEYLPMKPMLSAIGLTRLVPGTVDFWPGPGARSYSLPGFGKVGVQICYEIVFSGEVVDRNNRPDFLFNPSNDAWFGAWGPPQHLAQARLRAIEEGLPVIRSTPTGISAVINANGKVLQSLPYQKPGFIEARLPRAHAPTLFARYGNLLSFAFALLLVALGIALRRYNR